MDYEEIAQYYLDEKWPKGENKEHTLYCLHGFGNRRGLFFYLAHHDGGKHYWIDDDNVLRLLNLWLLDAYPQYLSKFARYKSVHIMRVLRCIKRITHIERPKGRFC